MSTVGSITKVAGTVVGRTVHTVTHPRESAAFAVGLARDAAGAVRGRLGALVTEPAPPTADTEFTGADAPPDAPVPDAADFRSSAEDIPDVETPVGTTGAGEGYNPDTTETDLQQPGTEPLMDPSLTKKVKSETDTLGRAAEPPTKE
jgi:hypothetical protein